MGDYIYLVLQGIAIADYKEGKWEVYEKNKKSEITYVHSCIRTNYYKF